MSWLNFNESLNSIRGQLSSFANGVLADGIVGNAEIDDTSTRNENKDFKKQGKTHSAEELPEVGRAHESEDDGNNGTPYWKLPPRDGDGNADERSSKDTLVVLELRRKIEVLENEKKELVAGLEQLDLDCQQTTDKLVTLKDNLQTNYNELKVNFEKLQKEYGEVLIENMGKSKEVDALKGEISQISVVELTDSGGNLRGEKNATLTRELENYNRENEELKLILEKSNAELRQMKAENEKLTGLYENLKLDHEALKAQLELLHHGTEELNVERERIGTENDRLRGDCENLKFVVEEMKLELEMLQQSSIEDGEKLKSSDEKIRTECEILRSRVEELNRKYVQEKKRNDKLVEDNENLKLSSESMKGDFEKFKLANEEVKRELEQLRNEDLLDHEKFIKEKENLHEKYLNIITDNMKKCIDSDADIASNISSLLPDEPQILEFAGKVETLLKLLLDFKCKTETLEKKLCEVTQEKNKVIAEKNFEIEKLLKNSEILSQEVIAKSRAIKDYEDECGDLVKNNDLLISELQNYKNNSGLQTISESNEDNLLLLESQLENANKRIQEMELVISDLESSKQEINLETQTELEYIKKQLNMTGQELSYSKEQYLDLLSRYELLEVEKRNFKSTLDKIKVDYENIDYKYTEANVSVEMFKEENEEYKKKIIDLDSKGRKLEVVNFDLEKKIELLRNVVDDLKQKLDAEVENTEQKELQMRNLVERLQNSKMCETGLKLQVDTIYKELQSVSEVKQTLEVKNDRARIKIRELEEELAIIQEENNSLRERTGENLDKKESGNVNAYDEIDDMTYEDAGKSVEEHFSTLPSQTELDESVRDECSKLKNDASRLAQQNGELGQKVSFLEVQLRDLSASRNELVSLITAKHQENVQYHGEIQRLNHLLATETDRAHELETRLLNLKIEVPSSISNGLPEELLQKIKKISQKNEEIEKLTDQNNFLREKCEVLAQNLLQEQSNVQKVLSERLLASEKEQSLAKELHRLRAHLVEIEEMYTRELLQAERKNKEMQVKVNEIEQREKDSSSVYTSVSIRANQQVETLQTQLQLVTNQRDELRARVSDLEDEHNKQVAALTNLQLVLEQFQKERDKDVYEETERVRRQVNVEKQLQEELRGEICNLKLQLEESKQGLQAASRLTDQLEKCKLQIVHLKDEVAKLRDQLKSRDAAYRELSTQVDLKVDKSLIKNLVIGYVTSHAGDQNQILKVIATVLDFTQKESDKVNLNKPQHDGWLSSILYPQSLNPGQNMSQQSLSEAFVRFLENESKPKVLPNLLITNRVKKEDSNSNSSATPKGSPSPLILSEVVLPTFVDFGKSRNSSSILKDVLKDNTT